MHKIFTSVSFLTLSISLICGSCGGSNDKSSSNATTNKATTNVVSEKPVKEVKSLSEDEIIELTNDYIKSNTKLKSLGKPLTTKRFEGDYNGDKASDFFVSIQFLGPAEQTVYRYLFYDSKEEEIALLKVKNAPKSFSELKVSDMEEGKISGTATVLFEAGDIGTFTEKARVSFEIADHEIVFDSGSKDALKKAAFKLDRKVDLAYMELEGDSHGE